jgi:hypothetical protein
MGADHSHHPFIPQGIAGIEGDTSDPRNRSGGDVGAEDGDDRTPGSEQGVTVCRGRSEIAGILPGREHYRWGLEGSSLVFEMQRHTEEHILGPDP